jgi:glycosyltransferase involved in cell wall biosynthesis
LIHAFEQFRSSTGMPWSLVFAGSDWHGASAIREAAANSPASAAIKIIGFVSDADLPALYRKADAFIYPSLYEGFGLPPVEAMACGTPVISSDRGALQEVVLNAALIVDPEDVKSMCEQMVTLATNPARARELRQAGLQRAAAFDWNRTARETLHVYARARAGISKRVQVGVSPAYKGEPR